MTKGVPSVQHDGLVTVMLHMICQNASTSASVPIRMLDVLTEIVDVEREHGRMMCLKQHADLMIGDDWRNITTPADLHEIDMRHAAVLTMVQGGPLGGCAV